MARSVRVYVKKQVQIGRLNFDQRNMALIGFSAQKRILNRTQAGIGPNDGPAKPLSKKWAAIKARGRLKPIRDLRGFGFAVGNQLSRATKRKKTGKRFIGHMLDFFRVSTVTENQVKLGLTTFAARVKGVSNQKKEPWIVLSPKNERVVRLEWFRLYKELVPKLIQSVRSRAA